MTTICPRCHTYCYGDCTASKGSTRSSYAPRRRQVAAPATEQKIVVRNVSKTRSAWLQCLAEEEARLARITNLSGRRIAEQYIAEIRAALGL